MTIPLVQSGVCASLAILLGACSLSPSDDIAVSRDIRDLCQLAAVEVAVGFLPTSGVPASTDTVSATLRFSPVIQRNPTGPLGCRSSGTVSAAARLPLGIGGATPSGTFTAYRLDVPPSAADSIGIAVDFAEPGLLHVRLPLAPTDAGEWFASRDSSIATGIIARQQ